MKKSVLVPLVLFLLCGRLPGQDANTNAAGPASSTAAGETIVQAGNLADEILKTVDKRMYPQVFRSSMRMTTYRNNRKPLEYTYLVHSRGNDTALMEITAPARDKGKKVLIAKNNLWMYIPAVSRPIRLSRKDSFMGSTFSNEDLLNSTMADDYNPRIMKETEKQYVLDLTARRKDVAYARMEITVDKGTLIPREATYFGLSGKAIKKMYFTDLKEMAGLLRPSRMKMVDLLESGSSTEVVMITLVALKSLPDYMFDQTQLSR